MQYRKELDGLRALAVLSVIIYHANLTIGNIHLMKGGYFGVDIFFVLSGFLITNIIRNQMDKSSFSFISFYWRRAKRIVPSMLVMLMGTSILAYFFLIPSDLIKFADSLRATLYFGSNYFFQSEDSYMAQASIYKPLLHTWSLAVEWQFYIIFPVIVWIINKFFKQYLFGILLALTLLSLQYANLIIVKQPDSAFYLLPTRAWELMLGGLVTFVSQEQINQLKGNSLGNFIVNALPILGLYLIVYSIFFFDSKTAHPSFFTLLPVLGTCLLIMFTHDGELTHDFFSLNPIVFIGTLSYSLYLWHQPLFVFFRILKHDYFRVEQLLLLIILSLAAAFISLKLVENPLRRSKSNIKVIMFMLTSTLVCSAFSIYIKNTNGIPSRFGTLQELYENIGMVGTHHIGDIQCQNAKYGHNCEISKNPKPPIIILGDSNADVLSSSIKTYAKKYNRNFIQLSSGSCTTLPKAYRNTFNTLLSQGSKPKAYERELDEICNFNGDSIVALIKKHPDAIVIYHSHNARGKKPENSKAIINGLNYIAKNTKELNIIYPIPETKYYVQKEILKNKSINRISGLMKNEKSFSSPESDVIHKDSGLYKLYDQVKGDNIHRYYMANIFCRKGVCYTHNKTKIFYSDLWHISKHGVEKAMKEIMPDILKRS